MNNTPLKLEGFSKNLRYIFTNKGMYDFLDDKVLRYESISLSNTINILQEIQEFEYKSKQISLQEHLSNPRRAMISLSEIFFPESNVTIVKEWETGFGNKLLLINESTDTLILEERINDAWNGIKLIFEELEEGWLGDAWDWTKKKASQAWNWIKEKAMSAWKCLTDDFTKCLMEGLREALFSPVGMAVEVFLTVTGIGAPVVMILWGLLLVWDVYLLFSGKPEFSWWNILFDVLGLVTSGTGAAPARAAVKSAGLLGKTGRSLEVVVKEAISKGGKVGEIIKTIGGSISRGLSSILGFIKRGTEWVSKNFGIKFLDKWVGKAKDMVDNLVNVIKGTGKKVGTTLKKTGQAIDKSIEKISPKTAGKFKKDVFGNVISDPAKISTGIRHAGLVGGTAYGLEKYAENKQENKNKETEEALKQLDKVQNLSADEFRDAGAF